MDDLKLMILATMTAILITAAAVGASSTYRTVYPSSSESQSPERSFMRTTTGSVLY